MTVFLDTNVLVYQFDATDESKRKTAQEVVQEYAGTAWISTQVMIEMCSALTRKIGLSRAEVAQVIDAIDLNVLPTDHSLVVNAAHLSHKHNLSVFDALIIEAAAAAGCETLLTEDMPTGAVLRGVTIMNPFN